MKKIISYCLWGDDPKYLNGLTRNLSRIVSQEYNIMLFLPEEYELKLRGVHKDVIEYSLSSGLLQIWYCDKKYKDYKLMFARFFPSYMADIDIMYSRDLDSPILDREIVAMKEFEESDKMFHIIRDHPDHGCRILGGTWGAKKGAIPEMQELVQKHLNDFDNINQDDKHFEGWYRDQHFLERIIYPKIRDKALIHDAFKLYPDEKKIISPFPTKRKSDEFVGMIINADGSRDENAHKILRDAENIN